MLRDLGTDDGAARVLEGLSQVSLVSCLVAMSPATTQREKLRFHTLNAKTGNRVCSRYVDTVTGNAIPEEDQAKAYPVGEDSFVIVEEEEIEAWHSKPRE